MSCKARAGRASNRPIPLYFINAYAQKSRETENCNAKMGKCKTGKSKRGVRIMALTTGVGTHFSQGLMGRRVACQQRTALSLFGKSWCK